MKKANMLKKLKKYSFLSTSIVLLLLWFLMMGSIVYVLARWVPV
ncbi:Uncharacterised protein [Serratia fonticola]|jgi:hypothetical protein|nr:hypothetical protein [Serratia fonticola]CAI1749233.1 Uncharacterised protein [Serratia fonticola]